MNIYFKYLIKKAITCHSVQGYAFEERIKSIYAIIREACAEEFPEDNPPTMDAFLRGLFEATQHESKRK